MDWQTTSSKALHNYRIFATRRDRARSPRTGETHDFYVIESADWINVIPVTARGEVVMIRQFRHGAKETTLEIPGGVVEAGEEPAAAAMRELREETGYVAEGLVPLGSVRPNPAIQDNLCHFFLAPGAELRAAVEWDATEEIEVELVALERIPEMIASGELSHALVICAFARLYAREGLHWTKRSTEPRDK